VKIVKLQILPFKDRISLTADLFSPAFFGTTIILSPSLWALKTLVQGAPI
jgi:hypothetical protein